MGNNKPRELERIQKSYNDTEILQAAYFAEFMYYKNEDIDSTKSSNILTEMDNLFPNSIATLQAHHQIENKKYAGKSSNELQENKTKKIAKIQPKTYSLLGNYPNPFNPTTTISYNLPRTSNVEITIYDMLGKEIRQFYLPSQNAGRQSIVWNGTDKNGEKVSSGIYIYHFKATAVQVKQEVFEKSAKLIMMK